MIETLSEMPAGTIGFRIGGRVDAADYRDVLHPALRDAARSGELRAVFVVGPDYEGSDLGAVREDLKGVAPLAFEHRDAWRRLAVVTDIEWIAKAVELFRWMMPGEVGVFAIPALEQAKAWVAASQAA